LRHRNRRSLSSICAILIAALSLPALASAQTQPGSDTVPPPPDYAAQAFDAVILRPLGFTAVIVGAAFFVPAAILTSPGGKDTIEEAMELLVIVPGEWVFTRPLGDF
jgi:hypothetical protein